MNNKKRVTYLILTAFLSSITLFAAAATDGTKTINVFVKDRAGNIQTKAMSGSIIFDTTAPTFVFNKNFSSQVEKTKVLNLTISDLYFKSAKYSVVDSTTSCNASVTYSSTYTQGLDISFSDEAYNGKKVCFSAEDQAGNISYTGSNVIQGMDTTPPTLIEVTSVTTPTNNQTPNYTFSSTESGTIVYSGACMGTTSAVAGNNTKTFNTLSEGIYTDCSIQVIDSVGNISQPLNITPFTIDLTAPLMPTSFIINTGDLYTNNTTLNLNITHSNESDVYQWCVTEASTANSCTWENTKPTTYILQP